MQKEALRFIWREVIGSLQRLQEDNVSEQLQHYIFLSRQSN